MRFVPTGCLKVDMMLGKTLYGENGQVWLCEGTLLKPSYIKRINELGYNGVYIQDDLSKDIEVIDVISEDLKQKTISAIKNVFIDCEIENTEENNLEKTKQLVKDIIEDILNNENLMVNIVDLKIFDDYTFYHSVNVAVLSIVLGVALKLNKEELYELGLAALLHDIGKVFISKDILLKPGKLTDEEFDEIKTHSDKGYTYLREKFQIPLKSYMGVLEHHERFDGSGYPSGKKGREISLFGRIISIADVYDALTSDRPYRKGLLPSDGMEYIMGGCGTMFDPDFVKIFARKVAPYPLGTCVKLSDNKLGIVVKNYEDCCMRPKVKIIKENEESIESYYIDLKTDSDYLKVTIIEVTNE